MKRLIFLLFLVFAEVVHHSRALAAKRKVLFIGNSYTATNNLPLIVAQIASSQGDTLTFDVSTPGGFTLFNHFNNPATRAKIALGGWDLVVLQAQSQEPAFPDYTTETLPYARKLDSLIHRMDSCTETQFYLTWGRKNGDVQNCSFYPPVCSFEGMQNRLSMAYLRMARETQGSVAPVGEAWRTFRSQHPAIELYQSDGSHPIVSGTYLAGLVFYQTLFHKTLGNPVFKPTGMADSTAFFMQRIARTTVQDSAKKWYQYGKMAKAGFNTVVVSGTGQASFENTGYAATDFIWNFGDGETSTEENPVHFFGSPGEYSVLLTVRNGCRSDTVRKTILIPAFTGTDPQSSETHLQVFPVPFAEQLTIKSAEEDPVEILSLQDLTGRIVLEGNSAETVLHTREIPSGMYHLTARLQSRKRVRRMVQKQ